MLHGHFSVIIIYLCSNMAKKQFTPIPPMAELPPAEEINVREILDKYLAGEIDLICVLGPTASGKTRYAVQLAREINGLMAEITTSAMAPRNDVDGPATSPRNDVEGSAMPPRLLPKDWNVTAKDLNVKEKRPNVTGKDLNVTAKAEIISADSRQVYRGMDIGTGKDLNEYEEIPYHLMDIVDAGEKYNIFEYQRDFEKVYRDIRERGCIPILCGGSGLYIEAATCGYSLPEVPANPELRAELEKKTDEELIEQLASLKPLHNTTDYDTRKRLIRALEIAIYEAQHPVQRTAYLPKSTYYIGTLVSRDERNARIDRRLDARLEEGMVEEIRNLLDGSHPALQNVTPQKNHPAQENDVISEQHWAPKDNTVTENQQAQENHSDQTTGLENNRKPISAEDLIYYGLEYKFVTQYIIGELSYEQMRTGLATAIHQFAKRQMTWFRGMERKGIRIHWTAL